MVNMTHLDISSHLLYVQLLSSTQVNKFTSPDWQWLSVLCIPRMRFLFLFFFFVLWDRHGTVSMFTWLRRDLSHKANVQYWPKYSLREWVVFAVCVNVSPERQTGTDIVLGRKQTQCRIIICLQSLSVTYLIGVDVTFSVLLSVVFTYKSLLM